MYTFGPIPSKVRCICTKSSIYFNLARGWTWKDKGNSSFKVISCVYSLWPNDYSEPPDIFLIPSYNRELPIVHWNIIYNTTFYKFKFKTLIGWLFPDFIYLWKRNYCYQDQNGFSLPAFHAFLGQFSLMAFSCTK